MRSPDRFYREVTQKLFSHFKIEDALFAGFMSLKRFIPADLAILQYTNVEAGTHRIVATADTGGGKIWNQSIPFTPSASRIAAARVLKIKKTKNPVVMSNHPEQDEDLRIVKDFFGLGDSSLLVMALDIGGWMVGSLAVFANGNDRYDEGHADLFALLRQPAAIVLIGSHLYRENAKLTDMLKDDNQFLHHEIRQLMGDNIVGEEFGLKSVMESVRLIACRESPVLLLGETGTGKDIIANAIHRLSTREKEPFIIVNCGAIPESLIDSELFGHEKGAFTGALSRKRGRFERANGGTIFLDEVGELPPQAQVRLLRVLQNKEIERVGGDSTITVDIRIIAATNRDLETMVSQGTFREDLWFRLNVFPLNIPALRDRKMDIPALVDYFVERKAQELKIRPIPKITSQTLSQLEHYHWPGNVRELENLVERALIVSKANVLEFPDICGKQIFSNRAESEPSAEPPTFDESVIQYFTHILNLTKGKIHGPGGAAELTGLNPSTLRHKLRKLGLKQ